MLPFNVLQMSHKHKRFEPRLQRRDRIQVIRLILGTQGLASIKPRVLEHTCIRQRRQFGERTSELRGRIVEIAAETDVRDRPCVHAQTGCDTL